METSDMPWFLARVASGTASVIIAVPRRGPGSSPAAAGAAAAVIPAASEVLVGAVTGSLAAPRTVLLGRYDRAGRLKYTGRSTTLSQAAGRALAELLTPPTAAHPWEGWTFSAGWGAQRALDVHLVQPDVVMEVAVDVARDAAGRWRHPARAHRVRADIDVAQVPAFGE
jgi:hypothetical protein